jgi:hypothetical protein
MHLQLALADRYRAAGRVAEARRLEGDVKRLLAVADVDHFLMKRLDNR